MALIDRTYFIGELNLAGTERAPVQEVLDWFIAKYEPELLERLLGYDLYAAFKTGLTQSTIEQRWTDLLEGTTYTWGSRTKRWRGLISQAAAVVDAIEAANTITLIVDRGHVYPADPETDPIAGASTVALPPSVVGKQLIVVQRVFGQLRTDEYDITGTTLTLLNGVTFSADDTYFIKLATLTINTSTGLNKESLIANYVYCQYMRGLNSQTTVMGEGKGKMENSDNVTAGDKIQRASYELDRWTAEMYEYLQASASAFPEWKYIRERPLGANAYGI
jgi:hypothetical protein